MKKRILFLVHLPPPVHGASLMNEQLIQSRLIQQNFDVSVLPLRFSDSLADIGSFGPRKLWLMFVFCIRLTLRLIRFRPHLVYFTMAPVGSAFYRDTVFKLIVQCFGKKIILHLHGKGIERAIGNSKIKKIIYQLALSRSQVVLLARILEKDIRPVYKGKIYFLANGVPPMIREEKKEVSDAPPVLLYLSNLVRSKGIEIFLECLKNLHAAAVPFQAKIVGAEWDVTIKEVENFIQANGLSRQVKVLGPLYGREKENILFHSDILVFPSFYENEAFPLTLLEAMQAGLAVVASNNGAVPEIVDQGRTGFVVDLMDTAAMIEKIKLLCRDEALRKQMSRAAKEKFERLYTIEKFEQGVFEIFTSVLN